MEEREFRTLRHQIRYWVEHQTLPQLFLTQGDSLPVKLLTERDYVYNVVKRLFKDNDAECPYKPDDYLFRVLSLSKDLDLIVLKFPAPEEAPLCYYSFLFVDRTGKNSAYLCLEKAEEIPGYKSVPFLCGWDAEGNHKNFGLCELNLKTAVKRAIEVYVQTERPGSFAPEGECSIDALILNLAHDTLPGCFFLGKRQFIEIASEDGGKNLFDAFAATLSSQSSGVRPTTLNPEDFAVEPIQVSDDVNALRHFFPKPEQGPYCLCSYVFYDSDCRKFAYYYLDHNDDLPEAQAALFEALPVDASNVASVNLGICALGDDLGLSECVKYFVKK